MFVDLSAFGLIPLKNHCMDTEVDNAFSKKKLAGNKVDNESQTQNLCPQP